jgi:hypothetical protein
MAEELPPVDTIDKLIETTIHLEVVREVASVTLHEEFAAYPELYAHATQEGSRLSESIRNAFAPTVPFPPQAKVSLATAYTRLLFMFTDPCDFKSTPPLDVLHSISFDLLASQGEATPNMVRFASELGGLALDLSLVRRLLKIRGGLDDIMPGQQLAYVKNQFDLMQLHWQKEHGIGSQAD